MGKGNHDLKPEHQIFCEEYVIDWNASRAYSVAYPTNTNSASIRSAASRLLTNDNIQAYIKEIQLDLSKIAGVSALRNVLELKKLSYYSVGDFLLDWDKPKAWDQLTDDQKACISEIIVINRTDKNGEPIKIVKYKLHDKKKAIEIMNQMLGWGSPTGQSGAVEVSIPLFSWGKKSK